MGRAHVGAYQVGYRQIGRRRRTGRRGPRAAELSACIIGLRNPLTPSFVSEVFLEDEIEGDEDGEYARLGSSFHQGAATALLADDPNAAFAAHAATAPGPEQADLLQLWDNHKSLVGTEPFPVDVRETEYGIGVTCHASGVYIDSKDREHPDRIVAVTMAGFADAVGREADGTPAVVELRTGGGSSLPNEPELYALGAHLLSGKTPITVHTHRIGNSSDLECQRQVFGSSELDAAGKVLEDAAAVIASWHPNNALSPSYSVGAWCHWCPFEDRCVSYRG